MNSVHGSETVRADGDPLRQRSISTDDGAGRRGRRVRRADDQPVGVGQNFSIDESCEPNGLATSPFGPFETAART